MDRAIEELDRHAGFVLGWIKRYSDFTIVSISEETPMEEVDIEVVLEQYREYLITLLSPYRSSLHAANMNDFKHSTKS